MLLSVENLQTHLHLRRGTLRAVDGVSLEVAERETLGLVGESGSDKTMTGLSLLRLLPKGSGRIEGGSVKLDEREITTLSETEMTREIRGRRTGRRDLGRASRHGRPLRPDRAGAVRHGAGGGRGRRTARRVGPRACGDLHQHLRPRPHRADYTDYTRW